LVGVFARNNIQGALYMMQSLFINQSAQPVPLNVVRESGTSTFYFALPSTLKLGEVATVMQCCQECSRRNGAQFQGMVTEEIVLGDTPTQRYVGRVLTWHRLEKRVTEELLTILRQVLSVPVVPVVRQ